MPQIEKMFSMSATQTDAVEAIAVSIGPGSFTGIRIGLATAKGLAYAWKIPLFGIPTMDVLAHGSPMADGWVCPLLDAQKGNVYQALYRWQDGEMKNEWPVRIVSAKQAVEDLAALNVPVLIKGDGISFCEESLGAFGDRLIIAPVHGRYPKASSVAMLGLAALKQGGSSASTEVNPLYVRRPEAEELWEKRHGISR
jgi:tRNA threonylcarbamoyladenosine biosynthesis protein TsaB